MFASLTGLALVDSLHLLTIAAVAYLLGTAHPLPRTGVFLGGLIGTHFAGGLLLVTGWGLVAVSPPAWWAVVEWGVVAVFVAFTIIRWRGGKGWSSFRPPASLALPATLALGVTISLTDLAFDLPYHLAAARIAANVPTLGGQVAWLAWFNLVYALPLLVLVAGYAVASRRTQPIEAPATP